MILLICLGIVDNKKYEELFNLKKCSIVLVVTIGKLFVKISLNEKVIKSKVIYKD